MLAKDPIIEAQKLFSKKTPILKSEDMPESWRSHIICKPMDLDWKNEIRNRPWAREYEGPDRMCPKMQELQQLLLSFGGEETCFAYEEDDLDLILQYGQLWNGWSNIVLMQGKQNGCHSNSALMYEANRDNDQAVLTVATGYALSKDGLWRQHSWVVERTFRSVRVIETTTKRLLYFGVALAGDALDDFLYLNG